MAMDPRLPRLAQKPVILGEESKTSAPPSCSDWTTVLSKSTRCERLSGVGANPM